MSKYLCSSLHLASRADELLDHTQLLLHLLSILELREKNDCIPSTVLSILFWFVHVGSDMVKNIIHHHLISKKELRTAGHVWRDFQPPFEQ